jgi:hypothetical protein
MTRPLLYTVTIAWLVSTTSLWAHGSGGRSGDIVSERLARLLGAIGGFTATAQLTVDSAQSVTVMEMAYAMREGRLRTELNLSKLTVTPKKGRSKRGVAGETGAEEMGEMGLDLQVSLVIPEKNRVYLIYPKLKAYIELADRPSADDPATTEWKELGKEAVDGHPCVKYLVSTVGADGSRQEMTVWKATDLKDFIIQSHAVVDGDTVTCKFRDIRLDKPPASLFELPAGFRQYRSLQELMMGAMQQMLRPDQD